MKRTLIVAAALSLLLPSVSMAQSSPPNKPGAPGSQPAAPGQPVRPQPPKPMPGKPMPPPRPMPGKPMPGKPMPNRPMPGKPMPPRPMPVRPIQGMRPPYHRPPVYVRPLPPRGNQFWHRGHYYGRIHGPAFVYPRGWRYRQWEIGQRLPPVFLAPSYAYPGWAALGLQAPVPGYSWVRFGPDLLLVNTTTGEVEDVVYGVFM